MKIKSLILAFPVLCFACGSPSSPSDPANQMDVSPLLARRPSGVTALSVDFNYDEPCNILGEEYIRTTFNLGETTELTEGHNHNGCEFEWAGNKVVVAFGGSKPYSSIYQAEYSFDKMYQAKSEKPMAAVSEQMIDETAKSGPEPEGNGAEESAADSVKASAHQTTNDNQPQHGGITAATPPLTAHAVSKGKFEAVANVGDKAVWDPTTGAMHVLYNNHIISITVETKDKPELKQHRAESLVEVLIDKISSNEYIRRL